MVLDISAADEATALARSTGPAERPGGWAGPGGATPRRAAGWGVPTKSPPTQGRSA
ncbi:hypothetical protein [Streptomyces sp. KR80]|uniref:hypothetical protein n=1 Tax=Streptomyces sp. KR80 TaxID=3457426 RepID=UPI003FD34E45